MPKDMQERLLSDDEQRDNEDLIELLKDAEMHGENTPYSKLVDELRSKNDAQFGIFSTVIKDNLGNEQWVRDATRALPIDERTVSHDAPVIEGNNALLRCLSRLSPIDYAIYKKHGETPLRNEMKEKLETLISDMDKLTHDSSLNHSEQLAQIKELEKEFDTFLIEKLWEANLTKQCETPKDAEKLLFHYRNLYPLLNPARPMITYTFDNEKQVLIREAQYPVTEKTPEQKRAIEQLKEIQPYANKSELNAHNVRSEACQEADSLFADKMAEDDRALPAQARKEHLVGGAKNAYVVSVDVIKVEEDDSFENAEALEDLFSHHQEKHTLWLGRMGSPVYVGKGERDEAILKFAEQNIDQVRKAAEQRMGKEHLKLHITTLNSYLPMEEQIRIIDTLYKAVQDRPYGDGLSYAPVNSIGAALPLDVQPGLFANDEEEPSGISPLRRADRLDSISKIIRKAASKEDTLSIVQCASGQDRSGTGIEKAIQDWLLELYHHEFHVRVEKEHIELMRATGGNAAEIATHHVPGSPGMKHDSQADNFWGRPAFNKEASDHMYLKSANTNKKNSVGDVDFLKTPSNNAVLEYEEQFIELLDALLQYEKSVQGAQNKERLLDQGKLLAENIQQIYSNTDDARSLADLSAVLTHTKAILENKPDTREYRESTKRLTTLSMHVSGKPSSAWQNLGNALLIFAGLALVVAGILAFIPTGGSSLLLTVLGLTGLSAVPAATVVGSTLVASGYAGTLFHQHGSEKKGLSRSIEDFKNTIQNLHEESESEQSELEDDEGYVADSEEDQFAP